MQNHLQQPKKGPLFAIRKWGWYLVLLSGRYFKVKLLYFKKGGEISLQWHARRNETWCFIFGKGTLKNYLDKRSITLKPVEKGSCQYIPRKHWHHYKADKRTLVLEVQTGNCYEGDIFRR